MKNSSNPRSVSLEKNRSLLLTDAKGAWVRCRDGGLWITQDQDVRDIVLAPGETFTFDRDGTAIVSALVGSSVELQLQSQSHGLTVRVH